MEYNTKTSHDIWVDGLVAHGAIYDKLDVDMLNEREKNFVMNSVCRCLCAGKPLTYKQQQWLDALIKRYPKDNTISEYVWH